MGKSVIDLRRVERGGVDVGDSGIAAFGFAGRPAHHFKTREFLSGGEGDDFVEGEVWQDGGDESELERH